MPISRQVTLVGHIVCTGVKLNTYKVIVKKCKENNYSEDLGIHRRVWAGNVVHITVVMNFRAPYHLENFWTS